MAKLMKKLFLSLLLILFLLNISAEETVKVTEIGSAAGTPDKASELALADAMRNAVRKGAGVDIYSETKVSNFQTEFDQVLTSSIGYIKDYKILDQGYDSSSKIYTVKIEAEVAKSAPIVDDVMALRMLVQRMDSPRLVVETTEDINGLKKHKIVKSLIEEIAKKTGFALVSQKTVDKRNERDALRSDLLGEDTMAKVKRAGITSVSDFKIIADVKGSVGKLREPFPDVQVRNSAISADLEAVWTDTGEVIAKVAVPTVYFKGEANMELPYDIPDQLMRYYLNQVLTGKVHSSKDKNAYTLFKKIISKWIVELDLGFKVEIEIKQIDKKNLNDLVSKLQSEKGISYVWLRVFDGRLYSIVELQTFINSKNLSDKISVLLGNRYVIDASTKRRIRFIPVSDK